MSSKLINKKEISSNFINQKEISESFKDGAIISATTLALFFGLKGMKITNPPTAGLGATDIFKLTFGICLGSLVKDYAIYKKWIND